MKNVLVTGVNGFVGGHLAELLSNAGNTVIGIARDETANDQVAPFLSTFITCDLLDLDSVKKLPFENIESIYHLAGLASVAQSFDHPESYMFDNGKMTNNLLSEASLHEFKGRTVIVSTGALYSARQEMPLSETATLSFGSPYNVGKISVENICDYYRSRGQDVVVARPFNHIGPFQGEGFLLPDLYQKITDAIAAGLDTVTTGNLMTERDYTDVRDIVRAYVALAEAPTLRHSVYNICSGHSLSGDAIFKSLVTSMDAGSLKYNIDPSFVRPNDAQSITGDFTRIHDELNWYPQINIDQTISDFVRSI